MILTDTHAHLYSDQFADDREAMIQRAIEAGVQRLFLPNIDRESIGPMLALCDAFPENCFPMMGLHPCDVKENFQEVLNDMRLWFDRRKFYAVGETGIDLYWDKTTLDLQIEAFSIQIEWAKELQLPIVIHARDSFNEIFQVLDKLNDDRLTGVFHCFTGSKEQAKKIMGYGGFMMGIGGVVTFEKAGLPAALEHVPLEYIVLETDSPYLAPKPYRGKRNESSYVRYVADKLCEVYGIGLKELAEITTRNSERLFLK